ncbi:DUF1761 domain-containing protein [Occallatibacter riparius]|uniref:DUF1761 domain-containing protein n=1 Tax=Occallatibacter riparius TaxID=1002689 RepID=A0A9J7BTF2_9BACT|nr:DUF1761 domain-containing protein [Occallatibacter riparius]UWZ85026.1 DUF1761 domain-containing protein [Occallatibacter riparius]
MTWFKHILLPVAVAVITAAVISAVWYSPLVFGNQWIALRSQALHVAPDSYIAPWKKAMEFLREVLVACVLLYFVRQLRITRLVSALNFGFWVWLGFPVSMLIGSSLWDNKPWALSLIHGGDWLVKMLAMSAMIVLTHRFTASRQTAAIQSLMRSPAGAARD